MIRAAIGGVLVLALLPAAAQQGEAAVTRRASELRDAPAEHARSLASLPAQSPVTRLAERQGPWVRVQNAAGATGWIHMFDVGPAAGTAAAPGSGGNAVSGAMRGLTSLFNKGGTQQQATTVSTSTIGIRGLEAQDIANAQPNPGAVVQMEQMRASEAQAREFAAQAPLAGVAVDPLPAPARAAGGGNPGQMP